MANVDQTEPKTLPVAEVLHTDEAPERTKRPYRRRAGNTPTTKAGPLVQAAVDKAREAVAAAAGGLKMACWFIDKAGGPDVAERLLKAAIAAINGQLGREGSGLVQVNPYQLRAGEEFMNGSGEVFKILRHELIDGLPAVFVENPSGDEEKITFNTPVFAVPKN